MNTVFAWLLPTVCLAQSSAPPEPEDMGVKFSTTVVESLFGTTVVDPTRLRGQIYYLKPGTSALPNFKKLKPVGSIYTNGFLIPRTAFDQGFPGVTDRFEWFAIDYTGKFYIVNPGKYDFAVISDDGSILYIDGKKVVRNDGLHPTRRVDGSATLTQGSTVCDSRISRARENGWHWCLRSASRAKRIGGFSIRTTSGLRRICGRCTCQRRWRVSNSSRVRGQSDPRSLERLRSASSLPAVWQRAQ